MINITDLSSDLLIYFYTNTNQAIPPLLDLTLQDVTSLIEEFKQESNNIQCIIKLAKYCAFYENYSLAHRLLNWVLILYPEQHQCHYFKAILYFKQQNIPKTLLEIENMLHIMHASTTQTKNILNRLQEENKLYDCIFFIDPFLKEFNLTLPPKDFNILILPHNISDKNKVVRYGYSVFFVMLCNSLQWIDNSQLKALLEAEYHVNGSSPWYHLCMGRLNWILNNREQTDIHFKKAKDLSIEQKLIFTTGDSGVYTWLSDREIKNFPKLQQNHDPFQLRMWQWFYADLKEERPDISIILGCDFKYFMYFPKFLLSLIKAHIHNNYQEKTIISLCLDNPSPEQIHFLRETAKYIHQHIPAFYLPFGYGLSPYRDGAYFASIRYLFAPELFNFYPTQTFIVDIDAYAHKDFYLKIKQIKENYDFALRIYAFDHQGNQKSGEPWCLGAGILYLGDLEKTQFILQFLKQYVNYAYDPNNPTNWCIDQCALVQAFDYYIKPFWDTLRITDIDSNPPFLLSHIIGEKDEFYRHEGVIDIDNFKENLEHLIHSLLYKFKGVHNE